MEQVAEPASGLRQGQAPGDHLPGDLILVFHHLVQGLELAIQGAVLFLHLRGNESPLAQLSELRGEKAGPGEVQQRTQAQDCQGDPHPREETPGKAHVSGSPCRPDRVNTD
jgi:hypothetical protein